MPDVPTLFLAASASNWSGGVVSATGVGRTARDARRRHDAERRERRAAVVMPAPAGLSGMAAGDDGPDAVLRRALCEMIERWTCLGWWHGASDVRALAPGAQAARAFFDARAAWPRRRERKTGLVQLGAGGLPPVLVAWSCDGAGRSICFGAACRPNASDAALGALRELYQMEFGLALERHRATRGVTLSPASQAVLSRAHGLTLDGVQARLLPQGKATEAPAEDPAHALRRAGLRWSIESAPADPGVLRVSSPDLMPPSGHVRWPFYISAGP